VLYIALIYASVISELTSQRLRYRSLGKSFWFTDIELQIWSRTSGLGKAILSPGIIFSDADNVIPDMVWISNDRLATLVDIEGHLTGAPELIIEVLSEGSNNERRDSEALPPTADRESKLKLYSTKGVREYWIVNWRLQQVEIYHRQNVLLVQVATLFANDVISSPLLPSFSCQVKQFFD
jgi:Uma2 family endonuclease